MKTDELDRLVAAGEIREIDRAHVRFIVRIIVRPPERLDGPLPENVVEGACTDERLFPIRSIIRSKQLSVRHRRVRKAEKKSPGAWSATGAIQESASYRGLRLVRAATSHKVLLGFFELTTARWGSPLGARAPLSRHQLGPIIIPNVLRKKNSNGVPDRRLPGTLT
jgi:hypothetical protein